MPEKERKYTLKPGKHCLVPGAHHFISNENTTDEDIEGLLPLYPHLGNLLEKPAEKPKPKKVKEEVQPQDPEV